MSKLHDDGDPWAPYHLLTPEQKRHQLNRSGNLRQSRTNKCSKSIKASVQNRI